MRKWIPAFLVFIGFAFGAMAYSRLTDPVILRLDALVPWLATPHADPLPRALVSFAFPAVGLAVWLLLKGIASRAGERLGRHIFPSWLLSERTGTEGVTRFRTTFDAIVSGVIGVLLLLHGLILAMALGWPAWTAQVFTGLLGLAMMVLGNIMPRTRPNWVAGLRTRRTLADPDVWRQTHRWFGGLLMIAGIAVVMISLFAAWIALLVALGGTLVAAAVATLVATRRPDFRSSGLPAVLALVAVTGALPLDAQVPNAAPVRAFTEESFDVINAGLVLPGTLTMTAAAGQAAVAVIIAGSSPPDRNGYGEGQFVSRRMTTAQAVLDQST